ncbi:MAG: mechanosensitive ion channel domain-containing protein, partial [Planctomycetota bacterium]
SQGLLAVVVYQIWLAAPGGVDVWWSRHRGYLQLASVGVYIALAGLAIAGYSYTAVQFEERLFSSVWLGLVLLMVQASTIRWLLLAYRELAIRRLRERRAAEVAVASGSTVPSEVTPPEPLVRLSDIDVQTRNILRMVLVASLFVGLLLIWGEILPALKIFRRVELWPRPFTILDTFGPALVAPGTLTLADGSLAVIIAGLAFASARNIPGLLEVTVLRRLTLDPGERFAVTTVCRYLISIVGIFAFFGQLGISWSQVQWLVAGMSLGLGFGLQEIFANFVSGLVLLFERPIRIGDTVTVGDITGKVSRIRIRATTITDWDLRELVIPNKEFITGKVMNWTLSDTVSRMTIQIGLGPETDPEVARQLLLQVAQAQPLVLKDPPPHALFDEFGESSLNFTLRVYMASRDVYVDLRHGLNTALKAAFRNAKIVTGSPQLDLNLRSIPEAVLRQLQSRQNDADTGKS